MVSTEPRRVKDGVPGTHRRVKDGVPGTQES